MDSNFLNELNRLKQLTLLIFQTWIYHIKLKQVETLMNTRCVFTKMTIQMTLNPGEVSKGIKSLRKTSFISMYYPWHLINRRTKVVFRESLKCNKVDLGDHQQPMSFTYIVCSQFQLNVGKWQARKICPELCLSQSLPCLFQQVSINDWWRHLISKFQS